MNQTRKNKLFTTEHKKNLSESHKHNEKVGKGRYYNRGIPTYDNWIDKLVTIEQCKRNNKDPNILEVQCTYCGRWYVPQLISVQVS